jgi:hypothetical protein
MSLIFLWLVGRIPEMPESQRSLLRQVIISGWPCFSEILVKKLFKGTVRPELDLHESATIGYKILSVYKITFPIAIFLVFTSHPSFCSFMSQPYSISQFISISSIFLSFSLYRLCQEITLCPCHHNSLSPYLFCFSKTLYVSRHNNAMAPYHLCLSKTLCVLVTITLCLPTFSVS